MMNAIKSKFEKPRITHLGFSSTSLLLLPKVERKTKEEEKTSDEVLLGIIKDMQQLRYYPKEKRKSSFVSSKVKQSL